MLESKFSPTDIEKSLYEKWEKAGFMSSKVNPSADPYTIMMPPPNVTGNLHMGHALTFTIQDILIRFNRMRGKNVLWQPGTDHAGIATQLMVERDLARQGIKKQDLGRDAFLEKVWEWKEQYGGKIVGQLKRLGATPDWSRERFTLDEGLSLAVQKVFVELYRKGLIYRDKRLVNWDTVLGTAVSDLEVDNQEVNGNMWTIRYPLADGSGEFIEIATTRPETMFGDSGVAVHPEDERYAHLIGRQVILPIADRKIPIVGDLHADPEKGTGAVKITPGHDFNDFEVGKRHGLEFINIMNSDGTLNDMVPETYKGLSMQEARSRAIKELEDLGALIEVKTVANTIPVSQRSGAVIEPWLTDQWYVDAATLAGPAIKAVRDGRTKFVPENWSKTYYDWLENIQPWCISRQLWWGHRIPAWYGPDGKVFVGMSEEEAHKDAARIYGDSDFELVQDEDVLDTWFSSALWPFSTLGWPEETPELKKYYPTDVLVTGHDIIFFWVARMMMMGIHFMGDVPFKEVYIHALIKDEKGQKMSKTKGNVIDPLELIDAYGADALRFTLAALAAPGRDVKFSKTLVEGYRNFATKLWNVARFAETNNCFEESDFDVGSVKSSINRWIITEVIEVQARVEKAIEQYRFNEAAQEIYQFVWSIFCDWFIEFSKPTLSGDASEKLETQKTTRFVLSRILHILHPFMPYITDSLWSHLYGLETSIDSSNWDSNLGSLDADDDRKKVEMLIDIISTIRSVRSEMGVPPKAFLDLKVFEATDLSNKVFSEYGDIITKMARVQNFTISGGLQSDADAKGAAQAIASGITLILPLAEHIDLGAERDRLNKEIKKAESEITLFQKKLSNKQFVDNAPQEIVEENRQKLDSAMAIKEKLSQALARVSA